MATRLIHELVALDRATLLSTKPTDSDTPQKLAQVFAWVAATLKGAGEIITDTSVPQMPVLVPFLSLVSKSLHANRSLRSQLLHEELQFVDNLLLLYPVAGHLTHSHIALHYLNAVMLQLLANLITLKHPTYSMYHRH
jgi:hypothetical protein